MKHYEIVVMIHPDQSEQVAAMASKYQDTVTQSGGKVHRFEDWGRRQLAYTINKIRKAHYLLFNVECDVEVQEQLKSMFTFNDAVMRYLILAQDGAVTTPSHMMTQTEQEEEAK